MRLLGELDGDIFFGAGFNGSLDVHWVVPSGNVSKWPSDQENVPTMLIVPFFILFSS